MKAIVSPEAPDLCFIFPALIVADATLWVVDYDKDGVRAVLNWPTRPRFLGQFYDVVVEGGKQKYGVSHLHIYTETGLRQRGSDLEQFATLEGVGTRLQVWL